MDLPAVLTDDLAVRLEQAAVAWSRAWLAGVEGIELGSFGDHLLVGCHRQNPELDFQNRVNGLRSSDADTSVVAEIVSWYAERNVRPWFEVVPTDDGGPLLQALTAAGADHIGYHGVVYGRPDGGETADPGLGGDIRRVDLEDIDDFATFRRLRSVAHDLPPEIVEQAAADLVGWSTFPDVRLYVASIDGRPVATAALAVVDGVAYLADGATHPAFRGSGLQSALIRRRLRDAADEGCDIACSQASVASASHRNLQRAGLTGGFTKAVWRVRPASPESGPAH